MHQDARNPSCLMLTYCHLLKPVSYLPTYSKSSLHSSSHSSSVWKHSFWSIFHYFSIHTPCSTKFFCLLYTLSILPPITSFLDHLLQLLPIKSLLVCLLKFLLFRHITKQFSVSQNTWNQQICWEYLNYFMRLMHHMLLLFINCLIYIQSLLGKRLCL